MCHILRFKQLFSSVIVFCLGTCEIQIDFLQLVICLFFLLFLHLCCSDPDISASWYTGRGIRPLGRFGRKAARRNELLAFITARVYRPTADSGVWITQWEHCGSLNSCYALIFFRLSNEIGLRFRSFLTLHSVIFCKFCINNLCFLLYKHGDKRTYVRKATCKVESVTIKGIHELMEHIFWPLRLKRFDQ